VRAAEEVLAGTDLADGIERLAVLRQVHAGEQRMLMPAWSVVLTNFS